MSYADMLKDLLAKKNEQQNQGKKKNELDIGKGKIKNQVTSHKPAKKSAGRGRQLPQLFNNYDRIAI